MPSKARQPILDPDLTPGQAEAALSEIGRLRLGVRRSSGAPWFPLVCFGAVTTVAGLVYGALGADALVATWLVAGIGALWITHRHYRRRGRRLGVGTRGRRVWPWSLGTFALCFAAAVIGGRADGREGGVVASIVIVVVAYLAFGSWQRRADGPLAVGAAAVVPLALAALSAAPWTVELVFGLCLLLAGLALWGLRGEPAEPTR